MNCELNLFEIVYEKFAFQIGSFFLLVFIQTLKRLEEFELNLRRNSSEKKETDSIHSIVLANSSLRPFDMPRFSMNFFLHCLKLVTKESFLRNFETNKSLLIDQGERERENRGEWSNLTSLKRLLFRCQLSKRLCLANSEYDLMQRFIWVKKK